MQEVQAFFTYVIEGKEIKDSKFFSIPNDKTSIESIIYNHLNTLYPSLVSQVEVTEIKEM